MFGYIRPYKPELKIKEYEFYNAVYCGLCHALRRRYGIFARLILSYDLTFLAMLKLENGGCGGFEKKRCIAHPFKKRCCGKPSQEIDFAADTAVIMFYYKLCDNLNDGTLLKKIILSAVYPVAAIIHRKAAKYQPQTEQTVKNYVEQQQTVELNKSKNIDEAAHPTALMMETVAASCAKSSAEKRIYERFGYFLGRWIYIIDAFDDIKDDIKHHNYNVFVQSVENEYSPVASGGVSKCFDFSLKDAELNREIIKEKSVPVKTNKKAEMLLNSCVYEMSAAFELLPKGCCNSIISNILYLGLNEQWKNINKKVKEDYDQFIR